MEADSLGKQDFIAVVVSKDELDYNQLNTAINQSRQSTYQGKVNEAIQSIMISGARFNNTNDGTMYFKVDANSNKAIACVVAIDKQ